VWQGGKEGDGEGRMQTNTKTNENPHSDLNEDLTRRKLIHIHSLAESLIYLHAWII